MIKRLLTYFLSAVILAGCSDSLDFSPNNTTNPDGEIQFTFDIPELIVQRTRTAPNPEYQVDDICVIVYGEDTSKPSQIERFYTNAKNTSQTNRLQLLENNKLCLSFRINEVLRYKSNLRFYFLANSPESSTYDNVNEKDLKRQNVSAVTNQENGTLSSLVMCSMINQKDLQNNSNIALCRNAAKVTVSNMTIPESITCPYMLYGSASKSPRMAYYMDEDSLETAVSSIPEEEDLTSFDATFFHPTKNSQNGNGIGGKLYVIAKIRYKDKKEYFYRLDFVGKDKNNKDCYISARPNHWYQFVILEVSCAGYSTPAEAARHPYNGLKYEIHDHSPVSYNMTSDGFRELGVSHIIEYSGLHNTDDTWSDKELFVKFFSKNTTEEPTSQNIKKLIKIKDPSWLQLSDAELTIDEDNTGGPGFNKDKNDAGKVYRLKIRFLQTDEIGSLENIITVNWQGLEREVPVIWTRNFTGADVTSVSLNMEYNNETTSITNYWDFLSSTDNPIDETTNALWGIQTIANNGKIRNQGFHFPVMYGTSENFATYSYNLTFDKLDKFKKGNVRQIIVSEPTDIHVTCTENPNSEWFSYIITRDNSDNYNYTIGNIRFTFTFQDNTTQVYTFQTYHTGFFHKDSQSHRLDEKDTENYYYYEVVPVMVDGQARYILDRNLAAKSAEMYVRDESGNTVMGNPDAAGGYYTIAYQKLDADGKNTYNDPILYDDTDNRVSPPGYRVPLKNAWGAIRTSPSFHNEAVNGKFPSYYVSNNPLIGNVYFPKSMLYMNDSEKNGSIKGEARSGYYWTGTAATGTEKDEIGKWLNMLMLSGSSTSYVNGCVTTNVDYLRYGASVRCINDIPDNSTTNLTSFNVTGATHVFLYKEEKGMRTPTTAWPGHSVGNFATMTEGRWFGFSFESTQFSPEELYVIFNFVDQNGIIYTYSCDKTNGSTLLTTNLTPSQCIGWKVTGDDNTHIKPANAYQTIDGIDLIPASQTALKNWWRCGGRTSETPYVWDYQLAPKTLYLVGDATQGKWDYNNLTPITPDSQTPGVYTWEGELTRGEFKTTFSKYRDDRFWSAYFFRPEVHHTEVSKFGITNSPMGEWKEGNGKPDNKWMVITPGIYELSFNINNMTFSANCLVAKEEGKIRITITNDKGWKNVYLYYWNSSGNYNNPWPGTIMLPVPDTENQFYLEIPEFTEYIIFNNGSGTQTSDIKLDGNYTFDSIP